MTDQLLTVQEGDLEWFLERAEKLSWRFASSMPTVPHSYVVRDRSWKADEHVRGFGVIRTWGVPGKFYDRTNLYLHDPVTNKRWWPMTTHHWQSKIINMAEDGRMYGSQNALSTQNEWFAPYDHVAAYFDDLYLETTQQERILMWKSVEAVLQGRKAKTLDLAAGNGGTIDARLAGAPDTTAVDISQGMLNDLVMKHPRIHQVVPTSVEEFLSWETTQNFGIAIASFGSASYLSPEAISMLPGVTKGGVVLSFYRRGYVPAQYKLGHRAPLLERPDDSEAIATALDLSRGSSEEQGNYMVITIRGEA